MSPATRYRRSSFLVPAELEDDLVADLWQTGTLGVQSTSPHDRAGNLVRLEAWFTGEPPRDLGDLEDRWLRRGAVVLGSEVVPEADWLALWRRGARPIPVGERFLLDPREPSREDDPAAVNPATDDPASETAAIGRHLLRLPARRAFGTGSHETTRLTLLLLEDACTGDRARPQPPPRRVLDVGTGTGVLAFAALLLGASRVVAYDRDPLAVFMARDNARLNGFGTDPARPRPPLIFAGGAEALAVESQAPFDLVLINILPHLVTPDLPRLLRAVAPGGAVAVAGMLAEEGGEVVDRLARLGFEPTGERTEGAWVAYRFERAGSEPPAETAAG